MSAAAEEVNGAADTRKGAANSRVWLIRRGFSRDLASSFLIYSIIATLLEGSLVDRSLKV